MRKRALAIMNRHALTTAQTEGRRDGFTVYMYPSTGTPIYVELRWYNLQGNLANRWVIHQ